MISRRTSMMLGQVMMTLFRKSLRGTTKTYIVVNNQKLYDFLFALDYD